MSYFRKFGTVDYKFGIETETNEFTNIATYSDVLDQFKDDGTLYTYYTVRDGERPDAVSSKLYGSSAYYWTFFLLNDHIREQGWPLKYTDLVAFMQEEVKGEVLVFSGSTTNPTNGFTQHVMTNEFPIGTNIYGTMSGAAGTVYERNTNLGQIFVEKTNSINFESGEVVEDVLSGAANYSLTTDSASLAYLATRHFEDGDGEIVDADSISGIDSATDTPITYEDYYKRINDDLSTIKVFRSGVISQFVSNFHKSVSGV